MKSGSLRWLFLVLVLISILTIWQIEGVVVKWLGVIAALFGCGGYALVSWLLGKRDQLERAVDEPVEKMEDGQEAKRQSLHRVTFAEEILGAILVLFLFALGFAFVGTWGKTHLDLVEKTVNFNSCRVEWLAALGWTIGLIGAIWAIWAKHMADKAFQKAGVAAYRSLKAYDAVSTKSIPFEMLIGGEKLLRHIERAEKKLRLLLGVPAVGYFRKDKETGTYPLTQAALAISHAIATKANQIATVNGKVDVLCLKQTVCNDVADQEADRGMSPQQVRTFKADIVQFLARLGEIPWDLHKEEKKIGRFVPYTLIAQDDGTDDKPFDPGIRIAIIDDNSNKGIRSEKAIVWFVADFLDETPGNFKAAALETWDPAILDLLNNLVDYYILRLAEDAEEPQEPGARNAPLPPLSPLPGKPTASRPVVTGTQKQHEELSSKTTPNGAPQPAVNSEPTNNCLQLVAVRAKHEEPAPTSSAARPEELTAVVMSTQTETMKKQEDSSSDSSRMQKPDARPNVRAELPIPVSPPIRRTTTLSVGKKEEAHS